MSFVLTDGGIEMLFSLPGDEDRVSITVQLLELKRPTPSRAEATLSDGVHFCDITFAKQLHKIIAALELQRGSILTMTNYITQPLDDKLVAICLDASVIGYSESIIGEPSEFVPVPVVNFTKDFVGSVNSENQHCTYCKEETCDWTLYGPTIVQSVRSAHGTPSVHSCSNNKAARFAAYTMYARLKFGYLEKGNRKLLPTCVTNGIRANFPDPNETYVGFVPSRLDD